MNNIFISRVETINQEILAAFEQLLPQLTYAPIPVLQDLQELVDSPSVLIIARQSKSTGPIIGSGTLGIFRTPSGLHAHVEDVIVDENHRQHGLGQELVLYLLHIARDMNIKGVSLTCNPGRVAANRLYQKMGFKKWDTNTYWFEL